MIGWIWEKGKKIDYYRQHLFTFQNSFTTGCVYKKNYRAFINVLNTAEDE